MRYRHKALENPEGKGRWAVWDLHANREAPVGRFPFAAYAEQVAGFMNTADAAAQETCPVYGEVIRKHQLGRARAE